MLGDLAIWRGIVIVIAFGGSPKRGWGDTRTDRQTNVKALPTTANLINQFVKVICQGNLSTERDRVRVREMDRGSKRDGATLQAVTQFANISTKLTDDSPRWVYSR